MDLRLDRTETNKLCAISPMHMADEHWYKLPNCRHLLRLCSACAKKHFAISEAEYCRQLAERQGFTGALRKFISTRIDSSIAED